MKRLAVGFLLTLLGLALWYQRESVAANPSSPISAFIVTNTADSGTGSLRKAVGDANANSGPDTITFDVIVFATPKSITLTTGELVISDSVTITGPGSNLLTVSGNDNSRVFSIASGSYEVTFSGLTIANGGNTATGGGIHSANTGALTLISCIVSNNFVAGSGAGGSGGGIFIASTGAVSLINCTLSGNSATGFGNGSKGRGGGIFSQGDGTFTLTNCTVSDNSANVASFGNDRGQGGGIFNEGNATVTITNSTLFGNSANGEFVGTSGGFADGGAIFNANPGIVNVIDSTLLGNSANGSLQPGSGGGIYNSGRLTVTNSTLSGNMATGILGLGGAIFNGDAGTFTLTNSTLHGNSATGGGIGVGGGIVNTSIGTVTLTNNTLSGNSASGHFASEGGGIFSFGNGPVIARNNIVAGNASTSPVPDVRGVFTSQGHNLIGDGTGSSGFTGIGDQVGTIDSPINAHLAPLANNGGPTQTQALLPSSPAINEGDDCVAQSPGCLATQLLTDQRGAGFSRNSGRAVDIGAFEVQTPTVVGPGLIPDARSTISDQKPGSILFFNVYTSSVSTPNIQNTRISLTNINPSSRTLVHLFFVDGSNCSVADSFICLTPNQTTSFLVSNFDPGTTGYLVAVAVERNGCPSDFNYLIGDEYVKFSTGHAANLGAEAFSALTGGTPTCDANSDTAVLAFNGVSYNAVSRVLAVDNIQSRADGNDTLLILNRFGGNLLTGAGTLSNIFGILYNDAEVGSSFTFSPATCQFRSILSNNFPRTVPRLETIIPAGGTGWMKLFSTSDIGLLGAVINANADAGVSAGAFSQGHNLHKLRLTTSMVLTIPVFPPGC